MSKIKLYQRVKYAGDVHRALLDLGWELDTATAFVEALPDADVEPVQPKLRKAVRLLCEKYEDALNNPVVRDPVAWALYKVWKITDNGWRE